MVVFPLQTQSLALSVLLSAAVLDMEYHPLNLLDFEPMGTVLGECVAVFRNLGAVCHVRLPGPVLRAGSLQS